ncbi:MAG: ATP-binding protein [Cyclobacteriaceae bacterium]
MIGDDKKFANTLAIAGIIILVVFSVIFLSITWLSKQKAEEINMALYSGTLDKTGAEVEYIFRRTAFTTKNFYFNIQDSPEFEYHDEILEEFIVAYLGLDSTSTGVWLYHLPETTENQDGTETEKSAQTFSYWLNDNSQPLLLDEKSTIDQIAGIQKLCQRDKDYAIEFLKHGSPDSTAIIRCSRILIDENDEKIGVFGIDISFNKILATIQASDIESGDYIYLLDPQKRVLVHPDTDLIGLSEKDTVSNNKLNRFFREKHQDGVKVYDPDSMRYVFQLVRSLELIEGKPGWEMGMRLPVSVARKDYVPIRNFMLLVGFCSFFLMGLFIIYSVFRWKREKEEKEHTEVLLSSSYAQLLSYMEGSEHVNIYSLDRNYSYLNFNSFHREEMQRNFGQRPKKGDNILKLMPDKIGRILKRHFDRALAGEQFMMTIEYESAYYQQIFNPIYDSQNNVAGLTCNFIDITDKVIAQKELEQYREHLEELVDERTKELRNQKEFFQMLIDQVPNQIFVRNREGVYVLVNKACAKAFGMTIEEMVGKTVKETHYDPMEAEVFAMEDQAILKDDIVVSFEDHVINKNGDDFWVIINKTRVSLKNDLFVMGVFVDITYLKTTETRLQQANNELNETISKLKNIQFKLIESEKMASLGQLMGGIAHEINNPINFVAGNVRPLLQDFEDVRAMLTEIQQMGDEAEELKEVIKKYDINLLINEMELLMKGISEGAIRISDIVNNLKTFARPSSEDFVKADIIEGLISTINLVRYKIRNRIEIETDIEDLPKIRCIPAKLNQVFLNLINNAVQAIPDKGKISISAKMTDSGEIKIEIADTGEGIPESIRTRVFDPFFTTKEVGTGTGLGLSLSFSIIKQHKGEIFFLPNEPKGTVFSVVLPVDAIFD